jgi:hypothetical protein
MLDFSTNFKKIQMNLRELELVAQWVDINKKLEAGWAPYRELAGQRDEIEKKVVFLKNKGVSPYPPKNPEAVLPPKNSETILLDPAPASKKQKKEEVKTPTKSEKEVKRKLEEVKSKGSSGEKSRSEIGLSADNSQNFSKQ